MKRIRINQLFKGLLIFIVLGCCSLSCKKKTYTFYDEMTKLKKYIADNNITTQPTASGLYYIETLAGTGDKARVGITVSIRYKGYLLDGTVFDQNLDADKPLTRPLGYNYLITGMEEGISYMRNGGKATLIIPSSLAYGYQKQDGIPAYSTLIFEIELVNVQ